MMNIPMGYSSWQPSLPGLSPWQGWMGPQGTALIPSTINRAPVLSTGGKIAIGALLFFLARSLFVGKPNTAGRLNTPHGKSVKVANRNWQPTGTEQYAPSYYSPIKQSQRMRLMKDSKGNLYSEGVTDLANNMRQTKSLQEAMSLQSSRGYNDWIVKDNPRQNLPEDYVGKGRHYGVQSPNAFDGFRKDDNGNPNKPRYVLMIGAPNKRSQFHEVSDTVQKEYGVPNSHVLYTQGTDKASIAAGLAKIQELTANQPHAEIVTFIMPDHTDRYDAALFGRLDESVPEGGHSVQFWDGKTSDKHKALKEPEYKALEEHYLKGKNRLTIFASCRGGSFTGGSIPPPARA